METGNPPRVAPALPGLLGRFWFQALLVLAASAAITSLFVALYPSALNWPLGPDYSLFYEPCARNLLAGHGYRGADGQVSLVYPPGFSLVLAAVFWIAGWTAIPEAALLQAMNVACIALAAVLLFALARRLFGPERALVPALAFSTYPILLYMARMPMSEVVFIVPFYGAVACLGWLAVADRPSVLAAFGGGVLAGLAMLVRPIAIGGGLLGACLLALSGAGRSRRTRLLLGGAVLLGNLAAVAPWEAWMYRQTGSVLPLCSNGPGSALNGLTFALDNTGRVPLRIPPRVEIVMRNLQAHQTEVRSMSDLGVRIAAEARRDPGAVARLLGWKVMRCWYATDSRRLETPLAVAQGFYLVLILAATVIAFRKGAAARWVALAAWAVTFYFWAMTAIALSLLRYLVPCMGGLFLILAAALPERFGRFPARAPRP